MRDVETESERDVETESESENWSREIDEERERLGERKMRRRRKSYWNGE